MGVFVAVSAARGYKNDYEQERLRSFVVVLITPCLLCRGWRRKLLAEVHTVVKAKCVKCPTTVR